MKNTMIAASLLSMVSVTVAVAATSRDLSAFRQTADIGGLSITVPAVLEVPLPSTMFGRRDIAVLDVTDDTVVPHLLLQQTNSVTVRATSSGNAASLTDNDAGTFVDFPVPEEGQGQAKVVLTSNEPITSTALSVLLDQFVALPSTIEIRAAVEGKDTIVVATKQMTDQTMMFPKTTAKTWTITFTYSQPLRISELRLEDERLTSASSVRFLGQPSHVYRLYLDPDAAVSIPVGESPNLSINEDVRLLPVATVIKNTKYMPSDADKDQVPDLTDNCVLIANTDQKDENANGRGDACDDFDKDGYMNSSDNCPSAPNQNQLDTDGDRIGDACDTEESRLTERLPWLPWVGMGAAAVVLVALMAWTMANARKNPQTPPQA